MAHKAFEPDDPMTPTAAHVPGADGAAVYEMAVCFAQEYLRMGWSSTALMEFFRNPFYQATHQAYARLGHQAVQVAIDAASTRERERRSH